MKKIIYILFIALIPFTACTKNNDGTQLPYVEQDTVEVGLPDFLEDTQWTTAQIADGIVWKYFQFPNIFDSRQYINIFDVDMNKEMKIEIPHTSTAEFFTVSEVGEEYLADIAINGSYFGTNYGGSTVYFKKDGTVITQTVAGFDSFRENGAFTIHADGKASIERKPAGGWDQLDAPYVLAGGPLLVHQGEEIAQLDQVFNTTRHPRTVIGMTADQHMIMVVIDGRSSESQGLTTSQLAEFMIGLGCTDALNMDGGGSSTAWTKGQGVVNHPTDNGKFDHQGQRAVATAIVVTAP